jgi:nucleoside-triphosphatase
MREPVRILLEGRPGSGKTTIVRRLVGRLHHESISATGFTTKELRVRGRRVGFAVESLRGEGATLASVDFKGPVRVGKYGVDLDALERVALPALDPPTASTVVVVDELGKMELASSRLTSRIQALFEGPNDIVAAVHVFKHPVTDELKKRADVDIVRVTRERRDEIPDLAHSMLTSSRDRPPRRTTRSDG